MRSSFDLTGVFAAVATPLTEEDKPDLQTLQRHLHCLEEEGCSGALLMGTTGEGPSLGLAEREAIIQEAKPAAGSMKILAGTGCASLADTVHLTRRAFELGADAVLVVPPFYYKQVSEDGLLAYYQRLLDEAVPADGALLLYHIPQVTQVPISSGLLQGLIAHAPARVAGIKDSSGDFANMTALCEQAPQLCIFTGDDTLLLRALQCGAAGCITAVVNAFAPLAVDVFRTFHEGKDAAQLQEKLSEVRSVLDGFRPFTSSIKHLLARRYGAKGWSVRPPLMPLSSEKQQALMRQLSALELSEWIDWL